MSSFSSTIKELYSEILNLLDDIQHLPNVNEKLVEHLEILKEKVKAFETLEEEREDIIRQLQKEVHDLKIKIENQRESFEEGQATWIWESHLTRFVIPDGEKQRQFGQYGQMLEYLNDKERSVRRQSNERLRKIEQALDLQGTRKYRDLAKSIREKRNRIAHPAHVDLEDAKKRLMNKTEDEERKSIEELFDIIKLVASLLKFGKLASDYVKNEKLFLLNSFSKKEKNALQMMADWNRDLRQLENGRLHCMKYDSAMAYVEKYVSDKGTYKLCSKIMRSIMDINGERLRNLAWEFENLLKSRVFQEEKININMIKNESSQWEKLMKITQNKVWSPMHSAALEEMKNLLPERSSNVDIPDQETAKCVIPDFLPESHWRWALDIVDWSKEIITPTGVSGKRKAPSGMNAETTLPKRKKYKRR